MENFEILSLRKNQAIYKLQDYYIVVAALTIGIIGLAKDINPTCYSQDGPVSWIQLEDGQRLLPLPGLQSKPVYLHPVTGSAHTGIVS